MAGHSKWSNIKNKKGANDAKRGKVFAQLSKLIRTAVKEGKSPDPNQNPGLRLVIDKARGANMPNENIQRAIDRGLGITKGGASLDEILYEGYGPNGVGFLVVAVTDNKMRTGSEIRSLFDKAGGSLGGPNSVSYLFARGEDGYDVTIPLQIDDTDSQQKIQDLEEQLLSQDDVEDVYHNAIFPQ